MPSSRCWSSFVRFELATDHPAVDPRLFASPPFAAAVLGVMGATVVLHASFILVPLLVEGLLGGTAQTARPGPARDLGARRHRGADRRPIVRPVRPPAAGRRRLAVHDRRARRAVVVAAEGSRRGIGVLLGVVGLGLGLSGSPRQAAAMDTIPPERVGMAAGTYYTGRYLGGVLGASLAGAVLGASVTGAGVTAGFGLLTIVGLGIVAVSFGLPDRPRRRAIAAT